MKKNPLRWRCWQPQPRINRSHEKEIHKINFLFEKVLATARQRAQSIKNPGSFSRPRRWQLWFFIASGKLRFTPCRHSGRIGKTRQRATWRDFWPDSTSFATCPRFNGFSRCPRFQRCRSGCTAKSNPAAFNRNADNCATLGWKSNPAAFNATLHNLAGFGEVKRLHFGNCPVDAFIFYRQPCFALARARMAATISRRQIR